jgi:dCMP deaminase
MENKWTARFMELAKLVASWSKDTNRKVGAIIVDQNKVVLSMGYNGFPRNVDDTIQERYEKPSKYYFTEHAERNALYHATRIGVPLKNTTIYITDFPCADCARGIIQNGIVEIITLKPDFKHLKWGESWKAAAEMFHEAKVKITYCL